MAKDLIGSLNKEKVKPYAPFVISFIGVILFFNYIFLPQNKKLQQITVKIASKKQLFSQVERTTHNLDSLRNNIAELEKEVKQLEERLPEQIEASMLIDTLKDITREANIEFVSIEPKSTKRYEQADQKQVYLELPISVRLKCGYNELIDFIRKIESSKRLMKVSDLKISANAQNMLEHDVEITISTFSTLKN